MKKIILISLLVASTLLLNACGGHVEKFGDLKDIPKKQKVLPEGLTEITFYDFGFKDGVYEEPAKNGQYSGESLDGTVFSGKITFSEEGSAGLTFGGSVQQGGFCLAAVTDKEDKEAILRLYDTNLDKSGSKFEDYYFYSDVAGVPLVGTEVDLKLSIQFVDADKGGAKNDVKLGVWFADKLYDNAYLYLNNYTETGHGMGTWMAVTNRGSKISIASVGEVVLETIPEGLKKLTIEDFGITPDSYVGGTHVGEYSGSTLDKTLVSTKVTFSEEGQAFLMIGGKASWGGFGISTFNDLSTGEPVLRLYDTMSQGAGRMFESYLFYSDIAGTTLIGEELDLQVSIEYVDRNEDGMNNDVKLGFWFNDKLYDNEYIYIEDYTNTRHSMGTWMTIRLNDEAPLTIQ